MTYHENIIAHVEGKPVRKIQGTPMLKQVDILQYELAKIAASIKTSLLKEGAKYGHLTSITIITEQEHYDLNVNQT